MAKHNIKYIMYTLISSQFREEQLDSGLNMLPNQTKTYKA